MKQKQAMTSAEFMPLSLRFVTDNLRSHVGSASGFFMMFCVGSSLQISVLCILYCVSSFCILFRRLPVSLDCSFVITHSVFSSVSLLIYSCCFVFLQKQFAHKNKLHQLLVSLKTIFSHPMHALRLFEVAIRPYVHSLIVVRLFVY